METEDIFVNLNDFTLIEETFEGGSFGQVFVVKENATGKKYAVKELDAKAYFQPKAQKLLQREVTILNQLHHIAIVHFRGFSFISFRDPSKWQPTIFTEFVDHKSLGKTLDDAKRGLASHEWTNTKKYINLLGISAALRYLHQNQILHRDLKPDNILLDHNLYPKVCDFGLSRNLNDTMTVNIGTKEYMAPEVLTGEPYGLKVDVYSFGILAFEIVTGNRPYPEIEEFSFKILNKIVNGTLRPTFPDDVKSDMKNLLEKCWDSDPANRPSFEEIYLKLTCNFNDYLDGLDQVEINKYLDLLNENDPLMSPRSPRHIEKSSCGNDDHYRETFQYFFSNNDNDKYSKNALCYACLNGYFDVVQFLLSQNNIDVNSLYTISFLFIFNSVFYLSKFIKFVYIFVFMKFQ